MRPICHGDARRRHPPTTMYEVDLDAAGVGTVYRCPNCRQRTEVMGGE